MLFVILFSLSVTAIVYETNYLYSGIIKNGNEVQEDTKLTDVSVIVYTNGEVISQTFGVERIPDPMLLKEMLAYYPGLNVDRLVAFSALIGFAKIQQSNRGYSKRKESDINKPLDNSQNLFKLKYSPFSNIGRSKSVLGRKTKRSGFKNFR